MKPLRVGFIPLSDCAVLAVAQEKGFFRRHEIEVTLSREVSWANVRDKVATGDLDAAQMLAGMPLAATAGIDPFAEPMVTGLSLGLNGNAITVSTSLWARMQEADADSVMRRPASAVALRRVIDDDRRQRRPMLRFAMVYPFSTHNYELRYWLAAAGIDPDNDVRLSVVPPIRMVEMLGRVAVDGFCVGEPWSSLAVSRGLGRIVATKYDIWNNSPEKVLAVKRRFAEQNPEVHRALLRAVLDAARWADLPENRGEVARILAAEAYIGVPEPVLAATLDGRVVLARDEAPVSIPDFHVFHRYGANVPWISHALWLLVQMLRWGQLTSAPNLMKLARSVYRVDLYRAAALELGVSAPDADLKSEGVHGGPWSLPGTAGPVEMGPDLFFDGREFHPTELASYLMSLQGNLPQRSFEALLEANS
ncbi:MAG: ABC transporter substrate-binding protein [Deltaproteobacteria bacterium]|nr:ABC transporter substrate-binding protein [Deltaproteobacteria bacterium]